MTGDTLLPSGDGHVNVTELLLLLHRLSPSQYSDLSRRFGSSKFDKISEFLHAATGVARPSGAAVPAGVGADAASGGLPAYEQELMQYGEYRLQRALLLYVPPILILLGTFGNIFSFIILKRKAMLKFSTYFYLMVLALADTLVLYNGLLQLWLAQLTGFVLRVQTVWLCKLTTMFGYTASDFSVWLIIAVTVERYIVVCHPLRAASMCSSHRARRVVVAIFILMLLLNLHFIWTVDVTTVQRRGRPVLMCDSAARYDWSMRRVWPWLDTLIYSLLPFVSIVALNALIIRQVVLARRRRQQLRSDSVYAQRRPSHEGNTRLTVMLLTISFAFLVTTLPMTVVNISANLTIVDGHRIGPHREACYMLARTVSELLMYVNHSMNFFLYCATGQKFRHQLVWMMCYARRGPYWSWGGSDHSQLTTKVDCLRATNAAGKIRKLTNDTEMCSVLKHDVLVSLRDS